MKWRRMRQLENLRGRAPRTRACVVRACVHVIIILKLILKSNVDRIRHTKTGQPVCWDKDVEQTHSFCSSCDIPTWNVLPELQGGHHSPINIVIFTTYPVISQHADCFIRCTDWLFSSVIDLCYLGISISWLHDKLFYKDCTAYHFQPCPLAMFWKTCVGLWTGNCWDTVLGNGLCDTFQISPKLLFVVVASSFV